MNNCTGKRIRRALPLFLAAVLFVLSSGCSLIDRVSGISLAGDTFITDYATVNTSHHFFHSERLWDGTQEIQPVKMLQQVAFSGYSQLYFDDESFSVGVLDMAQNKLWCSLPETESGVNPADAAVLRVTLVSGKRRYILNSQDNSVSIGTAQYENNESGITVTYILTNENELNSKIAELEVSDKINSYFSGIVAVEMKVTYELRDGNFYASVTHKNLGRKDTVIEKISFLEYFGSGIEALAGDFILVPDGSGALINTAAAVQSFEQVKLAVYGNDLNGVQANRAIIPAYGVKQGNAAFAAIIGKGDALATISAATTATPEIKTNMVGAEFTITSSGEKDGKTYFADFSYDDEIEICYRFLSGDNASYPGIAASCREQLVRDTVLSTRSVVQTDYLPLMLTLYGSVKTKMGISKTLTDFESAADIVARIKAKGINNIALRYVGTLSGGSAQENIKTASPLRSLGGKSGYNKLGEYMAAQKFELYTDINLLSAASIGGDGAFGLFGRTAEYSFNNLMNSHGFSVDEPEMKLRTYDDLDEAVLAILKNTKSTAFSGYCLNDVGRLLYSDCSADLDRQSAANIISERIVPLSTKSRIMVDTGNFRTLKNASFISGIPMMPALQVSNAYTGIPFVQLVLHGIVEYAPQGINLYDEPKSAFLKSVEYGALPAFEFVGKIPSKANSTFSGIYDCEDWFSDVMDYYVAADEALNRLRSFRMTDHYRVADGVYCAEYETVYKVYVNYTGADYVVDDIGITVKSMDFEYYPH